MKTTSPIRLLAGLLWTGSIVAQAALPIDPAPELPGTWPQVEWLEAQAPTPDAGPIQIFAIYQYQHRLLVITEPLAVAQDVQPLWIQPEPLPNKDLLAIKAPAVIAEYFTQEAFDASPYAAISAMDLLYTAVQGHLGGYTPTDWAQSPSLGWVFLKHYPWVFQMENQQWLYFAPQQQNTYVDFLPVGGQEPTVPCWFKPFPEWDGAMTTVERSEELYDSLLFRFWSPKSGWLVTDANLYPYCWSEAIEAWMLHRPVSVTQAGVWHQ